MWRLPFHGGVIDTKPRLIAQTGLRPVRRGIVCGGVRRADDLYCHEMVNLRKEKIQGRSGQNLFSTGLGEAPLIVDQ